MIKGGKMEWLYLSLAVIFEVVATSLLKVANGFTVLLPSVGTVCSYLLCFYFLSLALRTIDISIAYAVWGALGIVFVSLIGFLFFHEPISLLKVLCIALIVIGTIGLRLAQIFPER